MKLPILLKSLQVPERREFEKFLQSPYFKSSEQYLEYFRYLCKRHPDFELDKEDLQKAYKRCFGEKSLTDTRLYNLLSGLGKQLERFLVVQLVMAPEDPGDVLYDHLLVKSLGMRNMGDYFRTEAEDLIETITRRPVKEIDDYLVLQRLHQQVYYNPDTPKFSEHPPHLQLAVNNLDLHYCIAKLRYVAEMKAREQILDVRYEMLLLEAVLEYTANPELQEKHPLLAIYHHLVCFYREGLSEAGFRSLLQVFTTQFSRLPKTDQGVHLTHLINCGISLLTRGAAVEPELLSLYKLSIEADLLLDGNRITHLSFINIANLAALSGEFDWAQTFIARFSPYLEPSKQQPAIDLAQAGLLYNAGRLEEARDSLSAEIFTIPSFDLLARILQIRILFDCYILYGKDYDFLTGQITASEKFVQNKQLTPDKKDAQLNWIRFVRRMAATRFEWVVVPEARKAALRKRLEELQPIVSKRWLREKIELL